eukprot:scaffold83_cov181-Amphora_coffeaeformis.AAC.9
MGVAPFEIRSLLSSHERDESPTRRSASGQYSKFPRTARLRSLLMGVVALATLVLGLNLIESSRIPVISGKGEVKRWRSPGGGSTDDDDGAAENKDTPHGGGPQTTPVQGPISPALSPSVASPSSTTADASLAPTPMLRPSNGQSDGQLPVPAAGETSVPTESTPNNEVPSPNPPNNIPNTSSTNFTYPEALIPVMSNASQSFVERWCDLEGTDWYPKGDNLWKLRAPAFLVPGAKYSGVFALTNLLDHHPQIRPPSKGPETQFFFDTNFQKYVRRNEKTTVMQARERLLAANYPALDFQKAPGSISYDATAGYLFRSNVLPRRLLCVLPWIKMVVVLRDPIERLYQHFLSMKTTHNLPHELEDWIEKDMNLMRISGLISNTTDAPNKMNSQTEDVAWYHYQHGAVDGPVGRSLYEIQLRQWFQALRAIGREPKDSVLIVRTEEMVENPNREFKRILDFLDLSDFTPPSTEIVSLLGQPRANEITEATRKKLKDFFKPYNARLEKLLSRYKISYGSQKKKEESPKKTTKTTNKR